MRLLAGTDENSIKNVRAAEVEGLTVPDLVTRNAARFQALPDILRLAYDDFIRTSVDPRHARVSQNSGRPAATSGDLYKRSYTGLYCVGCEQFYKPDELVRTAAAPRH